MSLGAFMQAVDFDKSYWFENRAEVIVALCCARLRDYGADNVAKRGLAGQWAK